MKVAVMQPYFFPYLGYFQLISMADVFVIYDNIQYTKKGWINRNRMLLNGTDHFFTLPLKKDSNFLDVNQRFLADDFETSRRYLHNLISNAYRKAPFFEETIPVFDKALDFEDRNLFTYIFNSVRILCDYLEIKTKLVPSSTIKIDPELKAEQRVMATCKALGATIYINPSKAAALYDPRLFSDNGLILNIHQIKEIRYPQFGNEFVPLLSIVDVLMFNGRERTMDLIKEFTVH